MPYTEPVYVASKNGKKKLLDNDGKALTECIYDEIKDMGNGTLLVRIGTLYGALDNKGKIIVSIKYNSIEKYGHSKTLFIVSKDH